MSQLNLTRTVDRDDRAKCSCPLCSGVRVKNTFFPISLDCSQSPYFSVGFSRPVHFDGTAAILVCKSERDLGRVSKLPRGAGVGVCIVVV